MGIGDYHISKPKERSIDEITRIVIEQLYEDKIKPLEESVKRLESKVKDLERKETSDEMGNGREVVSISYDKAKKEFEELMTKAVSQVSFSNGLSGEDYLKGNRDMKCPYCFRKVKYWGCNPHAEFNGNEIVSGVYCGDDKRFYPKYKTKLPKVILEYFGGSKEKLPQTRQKR